ncbi:hypothetical protein A3A60_00915 [Candidatus Curtissbacteria bacterium RIFCSPLOWO2_01_FULL_42_26]|uniref:Glycosyltransferase RgtA/B/C/D-like domain-containing protein n=1 Tax=Candidatus Curtissbacteria bacterium RIFCSPLOWO2_01_FULL_42_26 TaxID=1797729 RepID=A0A1F5HXM4_9BACT|nr:MAG: hypothetical protein A3A60_00915 [Candidatus Curtissbacteria bacterium RIFCSPLOWO2_01_FULL_42_26]
MNENIIKKISLLLLIYVFIVFGYIFSLGFYYVPGLIFLLISLFILLLFYKLDFRKILVNLDLHTLVDFVLVLFVYLSLVLYGGLYQNKSHHFLDLSRVLLVMSLLISFTYFVNVSKIPKLKRFFRLRFWFFILTALFLRLLMIWSSPSPSIDVFGIQKIAPRAIIEGNNPYSLIYHFPWQNEPLDVYSYGPFNIFLNFPAVLLLKDPRYIQIISELGIALLIYFILKKRSLSNKFAEKLPLIFLFNPRALFILEQAWVDPILVFFVFLFAGTLFIWKREFIAFFILGLALATKQYAVFLFPFLLMGGFLKIRNFLITVGVVIVTSLPFLIWNAKDFIRDVVLFNLILQKSRYDSLSLNTSFHNLTGDDIPKFFVVILELLLLLYLLRIQKKLIGSFVIFNSGVFALSTYLLYRLAFIHYYYFAGSMIFLATVLMIYEDAVENKKIRS